MWSTEPLGSGIRSGWESEIVRFQHDRGKGFKQEPSIVWEAMDSSTFGDV